MDDLVEKDAEIQALLAELDTTKGQAEFYRTELNKNQRKAERLAEALKEIERRMPAGQAGPAWIARGIASSALRRNQDPPTNNRETPT